MFLSSILDQHDLHLVVDLVALQLLVVRNVAVHLVDADADSFDTQQVAEARMMSSMTLDLTCLAIALGQDSGELSLGRHHSQSPIDLKSTSSERGLVHLT